MKNYGTKLLIIFGLFLWLFIVGPWVFEALTSPHNPGPEANRAPSPIPEMGSFDLKTDLPELATIFGVVVLGYTAFRIQYSSFDKVAK